METAEVIAVGTELLALQRSDTNSVFLAGRLAEVGIELRGKAVVGDDVAALAAVVQGALGRVDLVITTGGLGPTSDDITRDSVTQALGLPLDLDERVLAGIRERFTRRGITMPGANRRQAFVPRGATVLPNSRGTAPGLWIEAGDRIVVLLPGPPRELQPMFEEFVLPKLAASAGTRLLRRRVLRITGRSESMVEDVAQPIYSTLGSTDALVATTILASPGLIEIHLSAVGTDSAALDAVLDDGVDRLAAALAPSVFSTDGRTLEQVVGDLLAARGLRLAAAESCTGGLLLGRMTEVPGSSGWISGGVVAYDNAVKTDALGVPADVIEEHGAVSEPVAQAMAEGVRVRLRTDIGVAITGIAGPSGGSPEKPVGTVAIAVQGSTSAARTFLFLGDRQMIRTQAVNAALDMVRRMLTG